MKRALVSGIGGLAFLLTSCNEDTVVKTTVQKWAETNNNYTTLYNMTCPQEHPQLRDQLFRYLDKQKEYGGQISVVIERSKLSEQRQQLYLQTVTTEIESLNKLLNPQVYAKQPSDLSSTIDTD